MLFAHIDILDENFNHIPDQFVAVDGARITYIGAAAPEGDHGEIYDGRGKLLMPGFVNAHSHSAMTLMRGYGENLALNDWLFTRIFPFEDKLTGESIYHGTQLAAAEMLRFGIVSTTDMYFDAEAVGRAVLESGIKMNFSTSVSCFDNSGARDLPVYQKIISALRDLQGAGDGRFLMDLALHSEYTTTEKVVRDTAEIALELGLRMQLHLSETKSEHEECKGRHGKTPARYFYDAGVFDSPTTAAHCVWVEDEDLALMKEKKVTVASCPVSNLKLASGIAPVKSMLDQGLNVALGTDSVASNNNLNMMEEVKLFATLFKAGSGDPTAVTPKQAIFAATRAGALAQGRIDCGLVKEGFRADLIVMDLRQRPYMMPCHDLLNNLVFSAMGTDVCLTMVDGRVLYRDGEYPTMDLERIRYDVDESIRKILAQL